MQAKATRPLIQALAAFVVVLGLLTGFGFWSRIQLLRVDRLEHRALAEEFSRRLRLFIHVRVQAAQLIRARIQTQGRVDRAALTQASQRLQALFPGYLAINWIDSNKRIRIVVPGPRNRKAKGRDLGTHPMVRHLLNRSRAEGLTYMSAPLHLYQGGLGFTTYSPLSSNGRFLGWLNTVYRIEELFKDFQQSAGARPICATVTDSTTGIQLIRFGPANCRGYQAGVRLSLYRRHWRVEVRQRQKPLLWRLPLNPVFLLVVAAVAAAFAAFLLFRAISSSARLRASIESSARDNLLLRSLVHDLANPLQAMVMHLELMRDAATQPDPAIEEIYSMAERQMKIIHRVRQLKGSESGRLVVPIKPVPLAEAVADTVATFQQQLAAKGQRIDWEASSLSQHTVLADAGALQDHVLANVISNAIKFSPPGGAIQIEAQADVRQVVLTVLDSGPGMDRTTHAALFDDSRPISRPGTAGETGTGFGMILVQSYMELFGGSVRVGARDSDSPAATRVDLIFRNGSGTPATDST